MLVGSVVRARAPLDRADVLGCDVVQLHLSAPVQWRDPVPRADADQLRASGRVVSVHAPYLCNPCSPDPLVRERTRRSLEVTLAAAATVGARGVVVHGGQAGVGGTVEEGVERWVTLLHELEAEGDVGLWIENTASGTAAPGRELDDWVRLVSALREVDGPVPIGTCLDTAHAFAGDPAAAVDPEGWVQALVDATGPVDLVHVNDSRVPAGAGQDKHESLGDGEMGLDMLAAMIRPARAPAAVLECPGDDDVRRRDLAFLRSVT